MGRILYTGLVGIYNLILFFSSIFNSKAEKIIRGRKETFSKIKRKRKPGDRVFWIHCASLGEFEQARPLIETFSVKFQEYKIYISFFSSSGYDIHQDYPLADCVFYLPADTRSHAKVLLDILDPTLVIFIKYEFWYNYLKICNKRKLPVVSVSTILRKDHFVFSVWGGFYRNILRLFNHFYVQNHQTRVLLENIGITRIDITGDTRVDRVDQICSNPVEIPEIDDFSKDAALVILGSTWKPDIDLWTDYINKADHKIKFVIAPHHINEEELIYIENKLGNGTVRFSDYARHNHDMKFVMIVDNIGKLSSIYSYGYVSYVGGSFSEGLHNILEPAAYGIPVLIGKHSSNRKYREALDLTSSGGAFEISNPDELQRKMDSLMTDRSIYAQAGRICREYIDMNVGATDKIIDSLTNYLE